MVHRHQAAWRCLSIFMAALGHSVPSLARVADGEGAFRLLDRSQGQRAAAFTEKADEEGMTPTTLLQRPGLTINNAAPAQDGGGGDGTDGISVGGKQLFSGSAAAEANVLQGAAQFLENVMNGSTEAAELNSELNSANASVNMTLAIHVLNDATGSMTPVEAEHNGALVTAATIADVLGVHAEDQGCASNGTDALCFEGDMEAASVEQLTLFQSLARTGGHSGSSAHTKGASKKNVAAGTPWSSGNVKYCFATDLSDYTKHLWETAVEQYKRALPCLSFENVGNSGGFTSTSPDDAKVCDASPAIFLQGDPNQGCWSFIGELTPPFTWNGKTMQANLLNIRPTGCEVLGIVIHELGHALGMAHEQSRTDRDAYVSILWENMEPNKSNNFVVDANSYTSAPYDYMSIMHYASDAFSINGNPTIATVNGTHDAEIGQRVGLSQYDADQLAAMYTPVDSSCAASMLDGSSTGCSNKNASLCSGLTACTTSDEVSSCCACGGGTTFQCWSGTPCPTFTMLPVTDHSACVQDITASFSGYDCVISNTCSYTVAIKCPESYAVGYTFNFPPSGPVLPPTTNGVRWSGPCAGTCTYEMS